MRERGIWDTMKSYSRLFEMYKAASEKPLDKQIIMLCEASVYVPLEVLLGQYKTLVHNYRGSSDYQCVRRYLISIFDEQIVDDLEAV